MKFMTGEWFKAAEMGLLPTGRPNLEQAHLFYETARQIYHDTKHFLENQSSGG
jgi:hypothetical protein